MFPFSTKFTETFCNRTSQSCNAASKAKGGQNFLSKRLENGHWDVSFINLNGLLRYTLLDLKNLAIEPTEPTIHETLEMIIKNEKAKDGGILPIDTIQKSDVCLNGMFLNYATYFQVEESHLASIVDFLLSQYMKDGGFNCQSNRRVCVHSMLCSGKRQGKVAPELSDKSYCATKGLYYFGVKLQAAAFPKIKKLPFPEFLSITPASENDLTAIRPILPQLVDRAILPIKLI